jgi:predicted transcriptional regulator
MGNRGTSDTEVLSAIRGHYAPAVGTSDIAEAAGVSRQAADNRLRNLEDDGLVESYKAGRTLVWYLTNAGKRYLDDIE